MAAMTRDKRWGNSPTPDPLGETDLVPAIGVTGQTSLTWRTQGVEYHAVAMPLHDVRDLERPRALADATLAAALEHALLCFDGLEGLSAAERSRLLEQIDSRPERSVLLGRTRLLVELLLSC